MGGVGKATDAPLTRYRNTTVTLDDFLPVTLQTAIQFERPAEAMGQTKDSKKINVHYVNQVGWQLRAYQYDYGKLHEWAAAQDGTYSVALGRSTVASNFSEANYQRDPGVTGGGWAGPSSGRPGLRRDVPAGGTFDTELTADVAAFPGPSLPSGESGQVNRVLVTSDNHSPVDQVFFWFQSPGHAVNGYSVVARFYFCGPAGSDDDLVGYGQYCLTLYGDGLARLYERGEAPGDATHTAIWDERFRYIYEPSRQFSPTRTYTLNIASDTYQDAGGAYHGTKLVMPCAGVSNTSVANALIDTAIAAIKLGDPYPNVPIYRVPKKTDEATQVTALRIDLRRDVQAVFHVVKATYPASGTLIDGVFSLDFVPTTDTDFTFEWYGWTPSGTTLDCKLYDADTGVELTGSLNFTDLYGGSRAYTPNDQQRFYRVKAFFTSDGNSTPTLLAWRLFRNPVRETPSTTPIVIDDARTAPSLPQVRVSSVGVTQQDTDPTSAGANLAINDLIGAVTDLAIRDNIPVKVETTYDSGLTNKSVLFRGYTQGATGQYPKGANVRSLDGTALSYPSASWLQYNVPCAGEWRRLQDFLAPRRFTFFERALNLPMKVTDAVRELLESAYDSSMVDVPDLSVRIFAVDQQQFVVQPGDPVLPVIVKLLSDYLGGWLVFDENAGTYGMWRVLEQKVPTYNNLARFRPDHPGAGKLTHVDGAYGSDTVGSQEVKKTFIRKGTFNVRVERPEGNCVAVYGGAMDSAAAKAGVNSAAMLTQVVYNVSSYNFLNLASSDPAYPSPSGNPDFLGYYAPIKVYDPTLSTAAAVNWVARRVFNFACHGRKILTFQAPLILVTDVNDTEQVNPRPLRFYDPVQVWNGSSYDQYIVRSCNIAYTKDAFQWANYELVTTSVINDFGAIPPVKDPLRQLARMFKRVVLGQSPDTPMDRSQHLQYGQRTPDWMALPEPTNAAIQDLDPASPTFGDFLPMLDFDGLS